MFLAIHASKVFVVWDDGQITFEKYMLMQCQNKFILGKSI